MKVDYLNPSRPFQWQTGGLCLDVRSGAKVDPDACEGEYPAWYQAQKAAKPAGLPMPSRSSQPAWMLPVMIGGAALLLVLMLKKG
jgi:hypothetical protein